MGECWAFLLGAPLHREHWTVAANSLPGGANPAFHFEVQPIVCPFQDLYFSFLLQLYTLFPQNHRTVIPSLPIALCPLRDTVPNSWSRWFVQALVTRTEISDPLLGKVLGFGKQKDPSLLLLLFFLHLWISGNSNFLNSPFFRCTAHLSELSLWVARISVLAILLSWWWCSFCCGLIKLVLFRPQ